MAGQPREQINQLEQGFWAYVKRQYKKNKRAMAALYIVAFLALIALFADFIANEKPIIAKYKGKIVMPIFKSYAVDFGLTQWDKDFQNVNWKKLDYDWKILPPIPYLPQNIDFKNARFVSPFGKQRVDSKRYWHWMGTDNLGRDVLSGMIHGTRIAFLVGIISMSISSFIGIVLGTLAGYFGDSRLLMSRGRIFMNIFGFLFGLFYAFGSRSYILTDALGDSIGAFMGQLLISIGIFAIIMIVANVIAYLLKLIPWVKDRVAFPMDLVVSRLIEILMTIPTFFLIITIVAVVKPHIFWVMVIIGATAWTGIARLIRAELLKIRNLEYIEAAQALAYPELRTMFRHAMPNALSPVLIAIAFGIAVAILVESTLSFLGVGTAADTITWGKLLAASRQSASAWWLAIFPGLAIFLTVLIFNLIGEGLSDALDPRLKK